jgi:predicted lipoprotein with Yx(FWY)xxD motif
MRSQLPLVVCSLSLLVVTGCSSTSEQPAATTAAAPSTVASASKTGPAHVMTAQNPLGTIVTDDRGRALYLFAADSGTTSTCAGPCAKEWPPLLTSGAPVAGTGIDPTLLATTPRPDGTTQLTYHGHPLYYYDDDDQAPGATKGQGERSYGAAWYVLNPAGDEIDEH